MSRLSKPALLAASLLSAATLSAAMAPGARWLIFIGLVGFLWTVARTAKPADALLAGVVTGTVYGLFVLYPLLSALDWTGWAVLNQAELAAMRGRQWWFLHALWFLLALVGGGVFWGAYGALLRALSGGDPWRFALLAPALWIVENEWLRSKTTWGFHFAFLGNELAPFTNLRQAAAAGGVWLLSAIAVATNVLVVAALLAKSDPRWRRPAAALALSLCLVWSWGWWRSHRAQPVPTIDVVAVQTHREQYSPNDFTAFGMDRGYLLALEQALARDPDLVVLPETLSFTATSLDGSSSRAFPEQPHVPIETWSDLIQRALRQRHTVVALGLESVAGERNYNSIAYFDAQGTLGWYHKRKLVPFGEYQPTLFRRFSRRGKSQFFPGEETRIVKHGDLAIGGFVCQEVLYPRLIRESVVAGANLLVSGGNDGVFSDPRVGRLHAELAQIRAVEAGRYLVRAMKTGVTAIIDPRGVEIARSLADEPTEIRARVALLDGKTLFVRFGAWPLWLAAVTILWLLLTAWRDRRRPKPPTTKAGATKKAPADPSTSRT